MFQLLISKELTETFEFVPGLASREAHVPSSLCWAAFVSLPVPSLAV